MDRAAKEARVYGIFQEISEGYDRANTRISLGLHRSWKRMLTGCLTKSLPAGAEMLDVCCGTGDVALEVAGKRRDVRVTGLDFSPAMLEAAERRRKGLPNVRFLQGNALELPAEDGRFAAACVSFGLRNTADFARGLEELKRVVRPGGWVYCLDSFVPEGRLVRPFYRFYFRRVMPRLGGGRKHAASYRWLYDSTEQFLRRGELAELFRTVGLEDIRSSCRMFGACALVWGRVPGEKRHQQYKEEPYERGKI